MPTLAEVFGTTENTSESQQTTVRTLADVFGKDTPTRPAAKWYQKDFGNTGCGDFVKAYLKNTYGVSVPSLGGLSKARPGVYNNADVLHLKQTSSDNTEHWVVVNPDGKTVSEWVSGKNGSRVMHTRTIAQLTPRIIGHYHVNGIPSQYTPESKAKYKKYLQGEMDKEYSKSQRLNSPIGQLKATFGIDPNAVKQPKPGAQPFTTGKPMNLADKWRQSNADNPVQRTMISAAPIPEPSRYENPAPAMYKDASNPTWEKTKAGVKVGAAGASSLVWKGLMATPLLLQKIVNAVDPVEVSKQIVQGAEYIPPPIIGEKLLTKEYEWAKNLPKDIEDQVPPELKKNFYYAASKFLTEQGLILGLTMGLANSEQMILKTGAKIPGIKRLAKPLAQLIERAALPGAGAWDRGVGVAVEGALGNMGFEGANMATEIPERGLGPVLKEAPSRLGQAVAGGGGLGFGLGLLGVKPMLMNSKEPISIAGAQGIVKRAGPLSELAPRPEPVPIVEPMPSRTPKTPAEPTRMPVEPSVVETTATEPVGNVFDTAPNIQESMIQARTISPGKVKLYFRGTNNEVFPGELFKTSSEARQYFKVMKAKAQTNPIGNKTIPVEPVGNPDQLTGAKTSPVEKGTSVPSEGTVKEPWQMREEEFSNQPDTVFHGSSNKNIEEIQPSSAEAYGEGIYLASSKKGATELHGYEGKTYSAQVDLKNPYTDAVKITDEMIESSNAFKKREQAALDAYNKKWADETPLTLNEYRDIEGGLDARSLFDEDRVFINEFLKELGYDGVKVKSDAYGHEIVAFNKEQVQTHKQLVESAAKQGKIGEGIKDYPDLQAKYQLSGKTGQLETSEISGQVGKVEVKPTVQAKLSDIDAEMQALRAERQQYIDSKKVNLPEAAKNRPKEAGYTPQFTEKDFEFATRMGALYIKKGVLLVDEFKVRMIEEYGEHIKPYLDEIYQKVNPTISSIEQKLRNAKDDIAQSQNRVEGFGKDATTMEGRLKEIENRQNDITALYDEPTNTEAQINAYLKELNDLDVEKQNILRDLESTQQSTVITRDKKSIDTTIGDAKSAGKEHRVTGKGRISKNPEPVMDGDQLRASLNEISGESWSFGEPPLGDKAFQTWVSDILKGQKEIEFATINGGRRSFGEPTNQWTKSEVDTLKDMLRENYDNELAKSKTPQETPLTQLDEPKNPEGLSGLKNEITESRGVPIPKRKARTLLEFRNAGRQLIAQGVNPDAIILKASKKVLDPEEMGVLAHERWKNERDIDSAWAEYNRVRAGNDIHAIEAAENGLEAAEARRQVIDKAITDAGTYSSEALAVRKMMWDEEFSLANMRRRAARSRPGGKLSIEEEDALQVLSRNLEEQRKQVESLESEMALIKKQEAREARAEQSFKKQPKQVDKLISESSDVKVIKTGLAEKLRAKASETDVSDAIERMRKRFEGIGGILRSESGSVRLPNGMDKEFAHDLELIVTDFAIKGITKLDDLMVSIKKLFPEMDENHIRYSWAMFGKKNAPLLAKDMPGYVEPSASVKGSKETPLIPKEPTVFGESKVSGKPVSVKGKQGVLINKEPTVFGEKKTVETSESMKNSKQGTILDKPIPPQPRSLDQLSRQMQKWMERKAFNNYDEMHRAIKEYWPSISDEAIDVAYERLTRPGKNAKYQATTEKGMADLEAGKMPGRKAPKAEIEEDLIRQRIEYNRALKEIQTFVEPPNRKVAQRVLSKRLRIQEKGKMTDAMVEELLNVDENDVDALNKIIYKYAPKTTGEKAGNIALEVMGFRKAFMTAYDISAPGRQGWKLMFANPKIWGKAFANQLRVMHSEAAFEKFYQRMEADDWYDRAIEAGVALTKPSSRFESKFREEAYMGGKLAEKIPGVAKSERAYTGFLDYQRFEVFKKYAMQLEKQGEANPKTLKDLASFVNAMSGRGELGKGSFFGKELNVVFFSPRKLVGDITSPFYMLSPNISKSVRKIAFKNFGAYVAGTTAIITLAKIAGGDNVSVDANPSSTDFGKVRIGDTRIDLTGGQALLVRYATRAIVGRFNADGTHKWYTAEELMNDFTKSKVEPTIGFLWTFYNSFNSEWHDYSGENMIEAYKSKPFRRFVKDFGPMIMNDVIDGYKSGGVGMGVGAGAISLVGGGVQTYPNKSKNKDPFSNSGNDPFSKSGANDPFSSNSENDPFK